MYASQTPERPDTSKDIPFSPLQTQQFAIPRTMSKFTRFFPFHLRIFFTFHPVPSPSSGTLLDGRWEDVGDQAWHGGTMVARLLGHLP